MIVIQLRDRVKLPMGQPLRLQDAARLIAPTAVGTMCLPCPSERGIWKLPAIAVLRAVRQKYPAEEVQLLGADQCFVHRIRPPGRDLTRPLRTAAAFLILCLGSALGLAWFHADVDMPRAQFAVYEALTGQEVQDRRLVTIPYVIGVALGVCVFYSLPSRKSVTPLEVKLTEYHEDMENTEGQDFD